MVQDPPTIECSLQLSFFLGLYHSASHEVLGSANRMEGRKVCVCVCVCVCAYVRACVYMCVHVCVSEK